MHYRLPFYERINNDSDYDFKLIYGRGKKKSKLSNTNVGENINKTKLYDIRIPLPFSPTLIFHLIKENPDIVFSEGSSSLINSSIAFIYSKLFNKKFIWWSLGKLKDKTYTGVRGLVNRWEHFIETHSDAIFTYSTQGANYFKGRGVDSSKIFVAVNVFDTTAKLHEIEESNQEHYLDAKYFNIGFIGTIQKTKNLELLIDVVNELNSIYKNFKLHIIGDGSYLSELKRYSGENNNIVFHGRMNHGSSKILGNCDVFVLPGLGGLAICEGMLNKLPIITGNADGTEYDLVINGKNGYIIEDMNKSNLAERIEFLYNNRDILNEMKVNSFKMITEELSFDNYYSVFKSMIGKLTNDK